MPMTTELQAMLKHRANLRKVLRDLETGILQLTHGTTHHLVKTTTDEIAALKVEIADLEGFIIADGGTISD